MVSSALTPNVVRDHALAALRAGLCPIPPAQDGSKAPIAFNAQWKRWQSERPTEDQINDWYSNGRTGLGLVCGAISGGLEALDIDDLETYKGMRELAKATGLGPLLESIEQGLSETSPNGARIYWKCSGVKGNTKLARRPKLPEEMENPDDTIKVLLETRGEGGFIITAPSHGSVHPSGKPYKIIHGSFNSITEITLEERESLLDLACTFDQMPREEMKVPQPNLPDRTGIRPGDDFNARADWQVVLEPCGWRSIFERNSETYWRRPGKDEGISATTNFSDSDLLYVFSTSSVFESERGYSKFSAYTLLNHSGDYTAAAKALVSQGYGDDSQTSTREQAEQEQLRRPLRFLTATEIASQTPEQVQYIAKPYLVQGAITELDGKIKLSGKTTFAMSLAHAVVTGGNFLDEPTMRSPVMYLTEQPPASLRESLRRANLLEEDDLILLQYYDTVGTDWNQVIDVVYEEMKRRGAKLLVVDTLPQFARLKGDSENNAGDALDAIQPLQALAAQGMGVLVIRHDRKAGGEVGDSARGSSAFGGAVDIILSLRRGDGNSPPTVRVIQGVGRFDGIPDKLVVDYIDGEYVSLGSETKVVESQARKGLWDAVPEHEEDALTIKELVAEAETVKQTMAKNIMKEFFDSQKVQRKKAEGSGNTPYLYWRSPTSQSEPPVDVTDRVEQGKQVGFENMADNSQSVYKGEVVTDRCIDGESGPDDESLGQSVRTSTLSSDRQMIDENSESDTLVI